MNNLNNKTTQLKAKKLDKNEISDNLLLLQKNWILKNDFLYLKQNYKNFKLTFNVIKKIGIIAEENDHHPDIKFGYDYIEIYFKTHSVNGLTLNDFIVASKIEYILER